MVSRVWFGLAVILLLAFEAHAAQKAKQEPQPEPECAIEGGPFAVDKVEAALRDAPTCSRALQLFSHCGMGATSDVAMGGIITDKCEDEFLSRLSRPQRRQYQRDQNRCYRRYRNESGSMYRSAEAYCAAEVAERYARRYGNARPKAARN